MVLTTSHSLDRCQEDGGSSRTQQDELSLTQVAPQIATKAKPIAGFDVLARKLQNAVSPAQADGKVIRGHTHTTLSDSQTVPTGKAPEVKKRVDGRCVQRLVTHVSDGRLSISTSQVRWRVLADETERHSIRISLSSDAF